MPQVAPDTDDIATLKNAVFAAERAVVEAARSYCYGVCTLGGLRETVRALDQMLAALQAAEERETSRED